MLSSFHDCHPPTRLWRINTEFVEIIEVLLRGGGGGGQLSLIPKIIETVIPKITNLWNLTIGGNFKVLSDPFLNR